jgi:hypothetical protein
MLKRLHVKYPLFLLDFNYIWIFSTDFQKKKNLKYLASSKSVQWESSCSMRTGEHNEGNMFFRNFAHALKNLWPNVLLSDNSSCELVSQTCRWNDLLLYLAHHIDCEFTMKSAACKQPGSTAQLLTCLCGLQWMCTLQHANVTGSCLHLLSIHNPSQVQEHHR